MRATSRVVAFVSWVTAAAHVGPMARNSWAGESHEGTPPGAGNGAAARAGTGDSANVVPRERAAKAHTATATSAAATSAAATSAAATSAAATSAAATSAAATSAPPNTAADGQPLAGRYGDYFYLRDSDDEYRLYLQGRAHLDGYFPLGPGVSDLSPSYGLNPTAFVRRARVELAGEFFHVWQWTIAGDWSQTGVDNASGQNATQSCTPDATTGALNCTSRSASVEASVAKAGPTDVYINYRAGQALNVQVGQFKTPFSFENRTSENTIPFLESAMAVRNLGTPLTGRDIGAMVWGESSKSIVFYSLGIFNGEGPNRLNVDSNPDVIGRVFFHPFAAMPSPALRALQLGGSARYGIRSAKNVGYDRPTLTTAGGYAFWRPTYLDSSGNLMHIIPSNDQRAGAVEFYWPIGPVDVTAEFIYVKEDTREARDLYQISKYTDRYGTMEGFGYYASIGLWLIGDRQFVRKPGYLDPPHIDFTKPKAPSRDSVEALLRLEQIDLNYDGGSRQDSSSDAKTPNGHIRVTALTLGLNYWATRRIRASLNYAYYAFPDSAPVSPSTPGGRAQSADQRALAPAQNLAKGIADDDRSNGHTLHEVSARIAVGF